MLQANAMLETMKKIGYFSLFMGLLNVMFLVIALIPQFITPIGWSGEAGPDNTNRIYVSVYNKTTDTWDYKYDADNVPVQTQEWTDHKTEKTDIVDYLSPLTIINVIMTGLFMLSIVLELFGINLGAMMPSGKKSGKGKKSNM